MESSHTNIKPCNSLMGNQNVNFGTFRPGDGEWDAGKACEWLIQHDVGCHKKADGRIKCGSGLCARHVRMGMEAGGMNTNGRPKWAWEYIEYLPKKGFRHICDYRRGDPMPQFQKGDIACYQEGNNPNVAGHICMYTGTAWVSDFTQQGIFVYGSTNVAHIFRYQGANN